MIINSNTGGNVKADEEGKKAIFKTPKLNTINFSDIKNQI